MPYSEEQLAELREKDRKAQAAGKPRVDMSQVPVTQKRPDHGKPRPQPVEHELKPYGFPMPALESNLPLRYFESHKNSVEEACCKDLNNLTVQYFCSNPAIEKPDFIIIECSACGRKHRRGGHGAGRVNY